jgi:hypothetical protein
MPRCLNGKHHAFLVICSGLPFTRVKHSSRTARVDVDLVAGHNRSQGNSAAADISQDLLNHC